MQCRLVNSCSHPFESRRSFSLSPWEARIERPSSSSISSMRTDLLSLRQHYARNAASNSGNINYRVLPSQKHVVRCLSLPFWCRCGDPNADLVSGSVLYLIQLNGWCAYDVHLHLTLFYRRENRSLCRHVWGGTEGNVHYGRQYKTVSSPIEREYRWVGARWFGTLFFWYSADTQNLSDAAWCRTRFHKHKL